MIDAQRVAVVITRLVALYLIVRGLIGALAVFVFVGMAAGLGVAGMAAGSVAATVAGGIVLFLAAPVIARVVTFDMG